MVGIHTGLPLPSLGEMAAQLLVYFLVEDYLNYWIDHGMVFDMGTGRSTSCLPLARVLPGPPQRSICWYILRDIDAGRRFYQNQASVLAET